MINSNFVVGFFAITLIILLLIIGLILVIVLARRQTIKQELNVALYQNKLNKMAIASLRAQMNPHFIFNCLNSIKLYTEQNDKAAASEYLTKFSKLIRNILDNTNTDKTTLSAEIETLQLYLDMETMRFKDKLVCSITIDKNVDADFIEIPPLLIQPYVENAIWHGIMPKANGGRIIIDINQNLSANELLITIMDNGIGRLASAQLKSKSPVTLKSYGTQISHDRIDLLNERSKRTASVSITDLNNENGIACGTLVTIILPLQ